MDKKYTITLNDGTKIENLRLNGNNFISAAPVTKNMFDGNCSEVTISDWRRILVCPPESDE